MQNRNLHLNLNASAVFAAHCRVYSRRRRSTGRKQVSIPQDNPTRARCKHTNARSDVKQKKNREKRAESKKEREEKSNLENKINPASRADGNLLCDAKDHNPLGNTNTNPQRGKHERKR